MAPMRNRAQSAHHAADAGEPSEIFRELGRVRRLRVQRRQRVRNAILHQVIAGRHLAAEAVAAVVDGHLARRIRRGLHQHRHVQVRHAQRIGDGALVAEIRQRDDDAVDLAAVLAEQLRARRLLPRAFPRRRTWSLQASSATASYPALSNAAIISERPLCARWSGKKPRFPTITPKVMRRACPLVIELISLSLAENRSV